MKARRGLKYANAGNRNQPKRSNQGNRWRNEIRGSGRESERPSADQAGLAGVVMAERVRYCSCSEVVARGRFGKERRPYTGDKRGKKFRFPIRKRRKRE